MTDPGSQTPPHDPEQITGGQKPYGDGIRLLGIGWDDSDLKLLVVTIVGTLAGGILIAGFVGISAAFAKVVHEQQVPWWWLLIMTALILAFQALGIFVLILNQRNPFEGGFRFFPLIVLILTCSLSLISLLTWVGIAAGIH